MWNAVAARAQFCPFCGADKRRKTGCPLNILKQLAESPQVQSFNEESDAWTPVEPEFQPLQENRCRRPSRCPAVVQRQRRGRIGTPAVAEEPVSPELLPQPLFKASTSPVNRNLNRRPARLRNRVRKTVAIAGLRNRYGNRRNRRPARLRNRCTETVTAAGRLRCRPTECRQAPSAPVAAVRESVAATGRTPRSRMPHRRADNFRNRWRAPAA